MEGLLVQSFCVKALDRGRCPEQAKESPLEGIDAIFLNLKAGGDILKEAFDVLVHVDENFGLSGTRGGQLAHAGPRDLALEMSKSAGTPTPLSQTISEYSPSASLLTLTRIAPARSFGKAYFIELETSSVTIRPQGRAVSSPI